jgi:hypothetical protein
MRTPMVMAGAACMLEYLLAMRKLASLFLLNNTIVLCASSPPASPAAPGAGPPAAPPALGPLLPCAEVAVYSSSSSEALPCSRGWCTGLGVEQA